MKVSHRENPKRQIGERESRRVTGSKIFVFFFLLASALWSAHFTFNFVSQEEERTFQSDFSGIAAELIEVGKKGEQGIVANMEEFAVMATSTALALNMTWPYVILPDFERRASASFQVSGAYSLHMNVLCYDKAETYEAFYQTQVLKAYYEGLAITGEAADPVRPGLFTWTVDETGIPITVPGITQNLPHIFSTQISPPPATRPWYNIDLHYLLVARMNYMNDTKNRARSPVIPIYNVNVSDPLNFFYQPIFKDFTERQELVAFASLTLRWMDHFVNVLHDDSKGVVVILENTCGQKFTYQINGPEAVYLGEGDMHDPRFDDYVIVAGLTVPLDDIYDGSTVSENGINCGYSLSIYPSEEFRSKYATEKPLAYTIGVLAIFTFTSVVFIFYDCLVQSRQRVVMSSAERSGAIVSSLFPDRVHDRLFGGDSTIKSCSLHSNGAKEHLQEFFHNEHSPYNASMNDGAISLSSNKPIADLYPHATVMFADIEGFTSWSSIREPTHVFTLLESIYQTFDNIAKRYGVYKVETVGDAYVAVAGVPEYREDHAVAMTRFARDCVLTLPEVVLRLERMLGPGTGNIRMRFGIHSGPVLAGVLRGDKARFQLFGDTVNTAARVENSGAANRVHMTEQTAELLQASGKGNWAVKRMDPIIAKGKGELNTYWLRFGTQSRPSVCDLAERDWGETAVPHATQRESVEIERLVSWNVEQLLRLLKQVVAARKNTKRSAPAEQANESTFLRSGVTDGVTVLDEVTEIITLPTFDLKRAKQQKPGDPDSIDLDVQIEEQLLHYITQIGYSYRNNPFHNFEHASHVAMSVNKLLSRIVAPDVDAPKPSRRGQAEYASRLHDHTYGITSDPLTHFALVLASLMHDADHRGVPNGQLAKEDEKLAALYRNKSIAEQNSVDLCWNMLMDGDYAELRSCIFANPEEMKRFRQIIVNSVLATDIFDKELATLRKNRWDMAFQESSIALDAMDVNRRATIVIEHIIQASDVAHTMQHWHVYTKWNERLFREMYLAYQCGRSEKDPAEGWYKGEIWFFDCYVIPLAKKLESCGVFGVSSDEYLSYAVENRKEWESKGKAIVSAMIQKYST